MRFGNDLFWCGPPEKTIDLHLSGGMYLTSNPPPSYLSSYITLYMSASTYM